jgi:uncharacterized LabA/DUF88 family protein
MNYAILLDGGFVYKKLGGRLRRIPTSQDVANLVATISAHPGLSPCQLLRCYYYDSPPAEGRLVNPIDGSRLDLARTPVFSARQRFHDEVQRLPDFALRLGETKVHHSKWRLKPAAFTGVVKGTRTAAAGDLEPNLHQKGVDLRIGLDMARLALRQLAEVAVVVTGDSDLVPAFKFVRREGMRVYLVPLGHGVYPQMYYHADLVLPI